MELYSNPLWASGEDAGFQSQTNLVQTRQVAPSLFFRFFWRQIVTISNHWATIPVKSKLFFDFLCICVPQWAIGTL